MNKLYLLLLPVLFASCFNGRHISYRDRIVSTWELAEVKLSKRDKPESMTFTNGVFRFYSSGNLEYKDDKGQIFSGTWKMKYHDVKTGTDGSNTVINLIITVVDFENHELKTEIFDDLVFSGQDTFRAYLYNNGRNVFYFHKL